MRKFSDLQLSFELELDADAEAAASDGISAEEARLVSEAARQALGSAVEGGRLKVEEVRWWGEYLGLVEKGWPWRVACYIAWAASPKGERWPRTLQELATEVLGLRSPRVVYTWREKYASIDTVVAMLQAAPLFEHRRDVIEALVSSATKPDYKNFNDRKLFLELTGDYVPRSQLELGKAGASGELGNLSDEELRNWIGKGNGEENINDEQVEG